MNTKIKLIPVLEKVDLSAYKVFRDKVGRGTIPDYFLDESSFIARILDQDIIIDGVNDYPEVLINIISNNNHIKGVNYSDIFILIDHKNYYFNILKDIINNDDLVKLIFSSTDIGVAKKYTYKFFNDDDKLLIKFSASCNYKLDSLFDIDSNVSFIELKLYNNLALYIKLVYINELTNDYIKVSIYASDFISSDVRNNLSKYIDLTNWLWIINNISISND